MLFVEFSFPAAALPPAEVVIKATALLLLAAAACVLLRRRSPAHRHLVWSSTLSILLILPLFCWGLPRWSVLPNWTRAKTVSKSVVRSVRSSGTPSAYEHSRPDGEFSAMVADEADPAAAEQRTTDAAAHAPAPHAARPASPALPAVDPLAVLCLLWATGALCMVASLTRNACALAQLSRRTPQLRHGPLHERLAHASAELRMAVPRLLLGRRGAMPMAWGILRPTVLLPAEAVQWTDSRLRAVLFHELAHLRRRDPLALLVAHVSRAVYWFHPLAWLAVRRLRDEQESACDDLVLAAGMRASEYAEHVLQLATQVHVSRQAGALALAMTRRAKVEGRLRNILDSARRRTAPTRRSAQLTVFLVVVMAGGLSMLHGADDPLPGPARRKAPARPKSERSKDAPEPSTPEPSTPAKTNPGAPTVLGVDLSKLPVARRPAELPDLYKPAEGQSGRWTSRDGIYTHRLSIAEPAEAWVKYVAARNRYYIEYRPDADKPETERTYGPVEGDPFRRLKLEEQLIEELTGEENASASISPVARMFRTNDIDMSARAIRMLTSLLEQAPSNMAKENYARQVEATLEKNEPLIRRQGLAMNATQLREQLEKVNKEVEALTVAFPAEDYTTAAGAEVKPPMTIPRRAWGETVRGLRMAILTSTATARRGESIEVSLVIENRSDHDIKFPIVAANQDPVAEVRTAKGEEVRTSKVWYSGWPLTQRYLLKPDERVVVSMLTMTIVGKEGARGGGIGETKIVDEADSEARTFLVHYKAGLGTGSAWARSEDGVMRRITPAKGEWSGWLESGEIPIKRIK